MVRIPLTADASLAAMRAPNRFGMAMAAMIRMIATTISNSISEKPFCFRISFSPLLRFKSGLIDPLAVTSHFIAQNRAIGFGTPESHCFQSLRDGKATLQWPDQAANEGFSYQILTCE